MANFWAQLWKLRNNGKIFLKCQRKKKKSQIRSLFPAEISFINEGEGKIFLDGQKLRELIITDLYENY